MLLLVRAAVVFLPQVANLTLYNVNAGRRDLANAPNGRFTVLTGKAANRMVLPNGYGCLTHRQAPALIHLRP